MKSHLCLLCSIPQNTMWVLPMVKATYLACCIYFILPIIKNFFVDVVNLYSLEGADKNWGNKAWHFQWSMPPYCWHPGMPFRKINRWVKCTSVYKVVHDHTISCSKVSSQKCAIKFSLWCGLFWILHIEMHVLLFMSQKYYASMLLINLPLVSTKWW